MTRIRTTHQLHGLITLDNVKQIAVFTDFDSAVLFRQHHPAWEVHIHLVLPRASHSREVVAPEGAGGVQVGEGEKRPFLGHPITAYLTDGETIYKQAVFTAEELGLANAHAQDETDGLLYWGGSDCVSHLLGNVAPDETSHSPRVVYQVVEEAILQNSQPNEVTYNKGISS